MPEVASTSDDFILELEHIRLRALGALPLLELRVIFAEFWTTFLPGHLNYIKHAKYTSGYSVAELALPHT